VRTDYEDIRRAGDHTNTLEGASKPCSVATAAEDLLEIVMRRYEHGSTLLTSNRPVEDWGKLLGDSAAVTAMLDRLLHHGHVLKCGPRSWRTKTNLPPKESAE
jgi:DNA replication protein DnaC